MPQSVTGTPFRTTISAVSHFLLLGFHHEKFEKAFKDTINPLKNANFSIKTTNN